MLTELTLTDWKSFGPKVVIPFAPLTLLVGPNGSGKSNVVDALRVEQGLALGLSIGEVLNGRWEGGREIWPGIRGGSAEAARLGANVVKLLSNWALMGRDRRLKQSITIPATTSAVTVSQGISRINKKAGQDEVALGLVHQTLKDSLFIEFQPTRMRGYSTETGAPLASTGENLSAVLARLCEDPRRKQDIVDWLSELCAPVVEDIDFVRTEFKDVMLVLIERGKRVSVKSISDGTLRFLGLLAALMTAPAGSILVMEEPDEGLHPPRIHLLAHLLETYTRERKVQVIATTHSPTLLEHLSDEALGNVVAFGRSPESGFSIASRLGDLEHFSIFRQRGKLAHLFANGWVEFAL